MPKNSKLVIDAANTVYIDYDVLELLRDFMNFGSKDKNITVQQLRELLADASKEIAAFL